MAMSIQLTNAGDAIIAAATGPVVLTSYKLGSQYGYVPSLTQTDILGTTIQTGVPSAPSVEDANTIRYSILLPADAGPFTFGEVGFFLGSILFAIGVFDLPANKLPLNTETDTGGHMIIDIHLPITNPNYTMWADVTQANTYKLNVVDGPHLIPKARGANPNLMMVRAADTEHPGFLAYTDRDDLWEFESFSKTGELTVISASVSSVVVSAASALAFVGSNALFEDGEILLQFSSGVAQGITRYCSRAIANGVNTQLNLSVPLAQAPVAGDKIYAYKPRVSVAPATRTSYGVVKLAKAADFPSTSDELAITPAYAALLTGAADTEDAFGPDPV